MKAIVVIRGMVLISLITGPDTDQYIAVDTLRGQIY